MKARVEGARGEWVTHVDIEGDPQAYAAAHGTRLLIDDGEGDPHTAMLVTADELIRVTIADDVITGLHAHVDTDDVPDRLVVERQTFTRGDRLRMTLEAAPGLDADAAPALQDAEHELLMTLRALVRRPATPDDERTVRRTAVLLRQSRAVAMSDILRCADDVLAAPWDPAEPA
jgi:hypothetical protein